jgi:hypothetical protein
MVARAPKTRASQKPISSIAEYLIELKQLRARWEQSKLGLADCWYRGVKHDAFDLVPGAYWHQNCDEVSLTNTFRLRAPAYLQREPVDDWEWYFLMQHYGLPTRLLDWTENPLVALYFALDGAAEGERPVVWMLDPGILNVISVGEEDPDPIVPGGEFTRHWLPRDGYEKKFERRFKHGSRSYSNRAPIAITPKRREQRIVAQQGMFTVHGADTHCLTKAFVGRRYRDRLHQLRVDPQSATTLREELRSLGISQSTLFPELSSVVMDIKLAFGVSRPDPGPTVARASTTDGTDAVARPHAAKRPDAARLGKRSLLAVSKGKRRIQRRK